MDDACRNERGNEDRDEGGKLPKLIRIVTKKNQKQVSEWNEKNALNFHNSSSKNVLRLFDVDLSDFI